MRGMCHSDVNNFHSNTHTREVGLNKILQIGSCECVELGKSLLAPIIEFFKVCTKLAEMALLYLKDLTKANSYLQWGLT